MINSDLPPILHRFRDIAYILLSLFGLTPPSPAPTEGFPWDDLRKISTERSQMVKVPNGVEILPKISIAWVGRMNVSDDRHTDGQ